MINGGKLTRVVWKVNVVKANECKQGTVLVISTILH